jgi:hypothetical protein
MTTPIYSDSNYGQHQRNSGRSSSANRTVASIILVGFVVLIVLVKAIRGLCRRRPEHRHQEQVRGDEGSNSPNVGADPRAAASSAEVHAAGPVVCMYRKGDGGQEATCPVCLSDFADGEAVSVLPACMHYYHPACIDQWLRARTTCPLCRAAPA